MGIILDSSLIIAAERGRLTPASLIGRVLAQRGNQELGVSTIGYMELVHGVYRADSQMRGTMSRSFINDLIAELPVHPFTTFAAEIAAKSDAEQRLRGITIPLADLLIGATALSLGFAVMTSNARHFRLIPQLEVIPFP